MKFINILIFLIFNSILWSLINSVKNNKNQNELIRVEKASKDLNKILNVGAESSAAPQIQKYKETLTAKPKITKNDKTGNNDEEKRLKSKEYNNKYYQKNKEKIFEKQRNYNIKNKEKINQIAKKYYQNNKKRINERNREYKKKYQLGKKIEKESKQNDRAIVENLNTDNNEGNLFINNQNNDCEDKGKELIVSTKDLQLDKEIIHLQKDTPNKSSHREEGPTSVNPQNNYFENNFENSIACLDKQENIKDGHSNQQLNEWNDLVDMNLFEDEKFLDYLNEVIGS
uniref:Uncharacterized protein n=1 Tax=Meloidogyne enterolobii TaxID=390850 RepID=A0A6V7V8P3_MELEN|nr:unnamed protein product [Meloidogyne enterolobii]